MADEDSWDADSFEPDEPIKKASGNDKWEGEDEEEDVKDNWDEEEEGVDEEETEEHTEVTSSEKKQLSEKVTEKVDLPRHKQEELEKMTGESEVSPETEPREESDGEAARSNAGVTSNHVTGIDDISPSSKDDFSVFEKLLKDKITPYDKSVHYCSFLESLFRNLCTPLEVEELKRISNGLTVLLSEKQRQEKSKGKKKKKGVVPGGGLKAKMKDDLADYAEFDGGYTQDYEDFM